MNADANSSKQGLLPLVIGVTGHRDLRPQDIPALEGAVRDCLRELRSICPNTPVVLLSPLAEGADRLVAKIALEHGVNLVVPLPLPRAEYERDFTHGRDAEGTAKSMAEFDGLLRRASRHFELPLASGNTTQGIGKYGPERDRQYLQVGAYIVRHSYLLIALWDGETPDPEPVGGTGQIVRYALNGLPDEFLLAPNPLDAVDAGPVVHIVTPRARSAQPPPAALSRQVLLPGAWGTAEHRYSGELADMPMAGTLRRHDAYNADAKRLGSLLADKISVNKGYVVEAKQAVQFGGVARAILDQYAVADTLALYFQQRRRYVLMALFSIAVAAVFFFEVYAHFLPNAWVLALYPLALLSGFGVYQFARSRDFHNKHLDYRALAEGLRVQLFWYLAGLQDEVSDHYLRKQRSALEWVRQALRAQLQLSVWGLIPADVEATAMDPLNAIRDVVLPRWLADQRGFFDRATVRDDRNLARRARWELRLVVGGMVAGALVLLSPLFVAQPYALNWNHALIVLMGLTPAIAAALGGYADRMAFAPQAKRYRWMAELFARAEARLRDAIGAGKTNAAQQLILELGNEALGENGDWVMMHRERPPEASKVG